MKLSFGILFFSTLAFGLSYRPGTDRFELTYKVTIPALGEKETGKLWIPIAASDEYQTVELKPELGALSAKNDTDTDFANRAKVVTFTKADAGKTLTFTYDVARQERGATAAKAGSHALDLRAEPLVPLSPRFKAIADKVTAGKNSDLEKGRAIYDYVLSTMKYDKSGDGWGRGDAVYACDVKTGNCTDFHALFIAVARSAKIPSRFAVGFTIPAEPNGGKVEGYHCWAEFLADGKWTPVDISEAWKHPEEKDYFFGHHPANRFEMSHGRFLRFADSPKDGPINFLVHPQLEVDGKTKKFAAETTFRRK